MIEQSKTKNKKKQTKKRKQPNAVCVLAGSKNKKSNFDLFLFQKKKGVVKDHTQSINSQSISMTRLVDTPAYKALEAHQAKLAHDKVHMRDLFAQDPQRFEKFSMQFERKL
jgi:hypothetical protein